MSRLIINPSVPFYAPFYRFYRIPRPLLSLSSDPSESKLTNRVRLPRRQAASANALIKVVLAVPELPAISTLAPLSGRFKSVQT